MSVCVYAHRIVEFCTLPHPMCCIYLFAFGLYFPQTHTRIVGSTRSVSDASGPGSNREAEGREGTQQTRLTHRMNDRKCELADAFGLADRENIAKRATTTTIIKKKNTPFGCECRLSSQSRASPERWGWIGAMEKWWCNKGIHHTSPMLTNGWYSFVWMNRLIPCPYRWI